MSPLADTLRLPASRPALPPAAAAAVSALLAALQRGWRRPRSPRTAALLLAVWMTGVANLPAWRLLHRLAQQGEMGPHPVALGLGIAVIATGASMVLLTLLAWPRVFRVAAVVLLAVAGAVQHYMLAYGIVVDPGMVANALQTNATETRDLLGWGLLGQVLLVAGPPGAWLAQLRLRPAGAWGQCWRNLLVLLLALAATAAATVGLYRELAPLVRNHTELRFMLNPLSTVTSTLSTVTRPWRKRPAALVAITAGTRLGPSYAAAGRPPLLVLVVGETARADHFALNGYDRDTTPGLTRRGVTSFTNVRSCGTNTLHSVPCMFSPLGKDGYDHRKAEHENLVDVLQAAGLAVLWLDNQAGCKGVCDRIAHASTADAFAPAAEAAGRLCRDGECLDELMLAGLDERLAQLPAERRARGTVVVMHQMGSHGPAYHRRSSAEAKRFLPECSTHALADCDHQALVNAYDNSIAETDRFLSHTIDWLQRHQDGFSTGMLYLSDHGESLGEYGLFLHGVPDAFAPEVQRHVPLVLWTAGGLGRRAGLQEACVASRRGRPLTHDNLFHTVLGLMDVQTPRYQPALDFLAGCTEASRPPDQLLARCTSSNPVSITAGAVSGSPCSRRSTPSAARLPIASLKMRTVVSGG